MPSVNVLTAHNDNGRTGANLSETTLTPANLSSADFGKLFSVAVDGQVYAQPLYVSALAIPGKGTHNVVFVATEHDSVYAFDADSGTALWHDSFINPSAGISPVLSSDVNCNQITPEIGVTATPVIDPSSDTLYVESETKVVSGSTTTFVQALHALDVGTGAEKFGGPVTISASVPGSGDGGSTVSLIPKDYKDRSALLLLNGVVYTSFASNCDITPAHGWVIGYNASTLQQVSALCASPNSQLDTVWMSNAGPAGDANNNVYAVTGNGPVSSNSNGFNPAQGDYAETVLKLSTANGLSVADYFTPYNWQTLDANDEDFGSGGLALLPDQPGTNPHLLVTAGKEGKIYLINRDNLGQFHSGSDSVVQELPGAIGSSFGAPAYFNGTVYYGGVGDTLKAFTLSNGLFNTTPASHSATNFAYPGTTPSVSANGNSNGIVWAIQNGSHATLHAYDAANLARELYNSDQAGSRDQLDAAVKFTTPTIADGKVFVGTASQLTVFGGLTDLNWSGGGLSGVPGAATTSASFTINRTYNISGIPASSDFKTSYYASPDATTTNHNDFFIGQDTITAAADKTAGTHAGTSAALLINHPGTWYIVAVLDSGDAIPEPNKANNAIVSATAVTVTGNPPPVPTAYDFGTATSPVASGYTQVTEATRYSAAQGYGWLSGSIDSRDRGSADPLTRDFDFTTDGTFAADVANGTYSVTVTLGDASYAQGAMGIFLQGTQVDSVTTAAGQFVAHTYTTTVSNGQLDLRLVGMGGTSPFAVIDALTFRTVTPPVDRFDFGTATSPVAPGYTQVTEATAYSAAQGYGWLAGMIDSRDRGTADPLTRDFDFTRDGTFAVDLANGTYYVSVTLGDALYAQGAMGISLQGTQVDSVTTAAGQFVTRTYTATVSNGQLDLRLVGLGGASPFAAIDALSVTAASPPLARYDFGTATSPVAPGYTQVTEGTAYSAAQGYGWLAGMIDSRDRGTADPLTRDFDFTRDGTFAVDLANGTYYVSVTLGDASYGHGPSGIFLQGGQVDTVTTAAGQPVTQTYAVTVSGGQLDLRLLDLGTGSPFVCIDALSIAAA